MDLDTAMELSFWKEEPLSPVFSGLEEDHSDVWDILNDDVAKEAQIPSKSHVGNSEGWLPDSPSDSCDSLDIQARAQLASQLLDDLDLIKDEPNFADWYETKTDLQMFDELPSPTPSLCKEEATPARPFAGLCPPAAYLAPSVNIMPTMPAPPAAVLVPLATVQQPPPPAQSLQQLQLPSVGLLTTAQPLPMQLQQLPMVADTQTLLQEFECVFDKVEQSHGGALTPPQSPPHAHGHVRAHSFSTGPAVGPQHLQQLIAEVDELASARAPRYEETWAATNTVAVHAPARAPAPPCAPPSPCSSSSSFSSDSPAPESPASPSSTEADDPEWLPSGSPEPYSAPHAASPTKAAAPSGGRRRAAAKRSAKPYSSTIEDKRQRKKEQNKNAATRYRMKKKAEVEEILGEESELIQRRDELSSKAADLSQEIRYLKGLMRELFRSKGLIK